MTHGVPRTLMGLWCLVVSLLFASSLGAQEKEKITVAWMNSREAYGMTSTPTWRWLPDGRMLWMDNTKPMAARSVEVMDPLTGATTPFVDTAEARASLRGLLAEGKPVPAISFPASGPSDNRALYQFGGDAYILDVPASRFSRVTTTPEEEKNFKLSPDGTFLSYVRANDLYAADVATGKEIRLTRDGSDSLLNGTLSWLYWEELFDRRDEASWWSPDSRAIAFLQTDESGVSIQHYVDIKPWTPRVIRQRYPKVGEKNPRARVGIAEVPAGAVTWVDLGAFPHEYIAHVSWSPDSKTVAIQVLNRLQTELTLLFVDRGTGVARKVLTETGDTWVTVLDDFIFLKDGKHFLWPSERDGYTHLYRYTMDGELVNQVTSGAWSLKPSGTRMGGGGAVVHVDETGGWVYFTALEKSPVERHLYRVRMNGENFERMSEGEGTHGITFNPSGTMYVDRYSSGANPPSLALHRKKDGKIVRVLAPPRTEIQKRFDIARLEFLTIPARDGFGLPATIMKPRTMEQGRKYPVIFYVYGGPNAPHVQNSWGDRIWENLLVQEGFIVMLVDNRSSMGISKTLENTMAMRLMGDVELNDLVDAARWVKALPYVDSARIGIWGWSGGGTYTLLGMSRSKEFKAGIDVAGVSDQRFYDTKWTERTMKTEAENKEGYEAVSLLKYAKDLHGKLLIVHGTHDDNVHPQNALAFADELIKANVQFEMMLYPMRGHGISDGPARTHLYTLMLDFWKRNL